MRRCGVTDKQEALRLVWRIADLSGLRFLGLTGYEGHCTLEQASTDLTTCISRRPDHIIFNAVNRIVGATISIH